MIARWMDVMDQNEFCFEVINAIIACVVFSTWWNNILWFIKTNFHFNLLKCCWLYVFQPNEKKWLCFSTYWKCFVYTFQPIEKNMAMLFNLLKKIWLCFSTCWKNSGFAFQPVEKILAMLFNFWKVIFYEFQVSEKFSWMVFRAWKVQKSLTVTLISTSIISNESSFHQRSLLTRQQSICLSVVLYALQRSPQILASSLGAVYRTGSLSTFE